MANKIDKGSGGKRGHSGKDNWITHQEEKALGRRLRGTDKRRAEHRAKKGVDPLDPKQSSSHPQERKSSHNTDD